MLNLEKAMKTVALAFVVALVLAPSVLAQSFNGAGRMSSSSPTGWSANPNGYVNTGWGNAYGNSMGNAYGRFGGNGGLVPNGMGGATVYPFGSPYVTPVGIGNGLYSFNGGGLTANMWRARSGYYYPWGAGINPFSQTIYVDQSGSRAQTVAQQPLSMQFTDMNQFLDDSHKNGKLTDSDYLSMKQRLKDIHSKERSYRIAGDGYLEDGYDAEIRQDLKEFSKLMVERIKL
jgi:hypothetical protein